MHKDTHQGLLAVKRQEKETLSLSDTHTHTHNRKPKTEKRQTNKRNDMRRDREGKKKKRMLPFEFVFLRHIDICAPNQLLNRHKEHNHLEL